MTEIEVEVAENQATENVGAATLAVLKEEEEVVPERGNAVEASARRMRLVSTNATWRAPSSFEVPLRRSDGAPWKEPVRRRGIPVAFWLRLPPVGEEARRAEESAGRRGRWKGKRVLLLQKEASTSARAAWL